MHVHLGSVVSSGTESVHRQIVAGAIQQGSVPSQRRISMNEDRIQGKWKQLKGTIQEKWGKLTNDDLDVAEGNTEYLAGKIQERYGMARDEAEKAAKEFEKSV
jgi:uncharacterized protein YjbJ (UPF0337 family)